MLPPKPTQISPENQKRLGGLIAQDNAPLGLIIHTRYEVLSRIGRGGMGEIFLARDLRLNRLVAMKLPAESVFGPELAAHFQTEVQTMSRIEHAGILPIHDFGVLPDGRLYYTMKHVNGQTLAQLMHGRRVTKNSADQQELIRVLASTCQIVEHAHQNGVIHRDLKPANIMIDQGGQVFVLDWGIAKVLAEARSEHRGQETNAAGATAVSAVIGTLQYMAPEQVRGMADQRSDVYALGAILYEMLTGQPQMRASVQTRMLAEAAGATPIPPREINPMLPGDLEAICGRAMEKDPARRYPSVRALREDLERWLKGNPVSAYSTSHTYKLSKFLAKLTALLLAGAIAVAVLLAAYIYWVTLQREARAWEKQAEVKAQAGDYEEAKRLLERARTRIAINEQLYKICLRKLEEQKKSGQ